MRRAEAEDRSPMPGRVLLVSGMTGIALLMGSIFWWTIIGPVIALGLVVYIQDWSRPTAP